MLGWKSGGAIRKVIQNFPEIPLPCVAPLVKLLLLHGVAKDSCPTPWLDTQVGLDAERFPYFVVLILWKYTELTQKSASVEDTVNNLLVGLLRWYWRPTPVPNYGAANNSKTAEAQKDILYSTWLKLPAPSRVLNYLHPQKHKKTDFVVSFQYEIRSHHEE